MPIRTPSQDSHQRVGRLQCLRSLTGSEHLDVEHHALVLVLQVVAVEQKELFAWIAGAAEIDGDGDRLARPHQHRVLVAQVRGQAPLGVHRPASDLGRTVFAVQHPVEVAVQMHGMGHTLLGVADPPDLRATLLHHDGRAAHVKGQPVDSPAAHVLQGQGDGPDSTRGDRLREGGQRLGQLPAIDHLLIHEEPEDRVRIPFSQCSVATRTVAVCYCCGRGRPMSSTAMFAQSRLRLAVIHSSHAALFVVHGVEGHVLEEDLLAGGQSAQVQQHVRPLAGGEEQAVELLGRWQEAAVVTNQEERQARPAQDKGQVVDARGGAVEQTETIQPGGRLQGGFALSVGQHGVAQIAHEQVVLAG